MSDDTNIFSEGANSNEEAAAIIVMPLTHYPDSKVSICKSAYSVSKFRYEHPNVYSDYLNASGIVSMSDQEIFEMDASFPSSPSELELSQGFKTDELMFEIDEGNLGVIGVALYAMNGSVFRFYLSQLMALESFIVHYKQEHDNGNIPSGFSLGDLN